MQNNLATLELQKYVVSNIPQIRIKYHGALRASIVSIQPPYLFRTRSELIPQLFGQPFLVLGSIAVGCGTRLEFFRGRLLLQTRLRILFVNRGAGRGNRRGSEGRGRVYETGEMRSDCLQMANVCQPWQTTLLTAQNSDFYHKSHSYEGITIRETI